jgi:ribonuclease HI
MTLKLAACEHQRWNKMRVSLFTDGSMNPKQGVGFGAYIAFMKEPENIDDLSESIKIKKFENTSSVKLELQTLLWALSEISEREVVSFTDSQNIVGLLSRKERLVENNYCSKAGRQIRNHELYKEFFEYTLRFNIQFHHIRGHKPSRIKHRLDEIFTLVDRASRNALRSYLKNNDQPVAGSAATR